MGPLLHARLLLPAAMVLALHLTAPAALAAEEKPLTGWTYTCANPPLSGEWADPNFNKLTDGDKDPGHSAIFGGGEILVEVTLPALTRVSRVVAYVHRHNDNYKLRKLVVEALQVGTWVQVGEDDRGFWGPTPQVDFVLTAPVNVTTGRLRLRFLAESIVSIQEVEIYGGAPAEAAGAGPSAVPTAMPLPLDNSPGAHVREAPVDGERGLVLENPFVRLLFTPQGGLCRSFLLKASGKLLPEAPGKEFVGGEDRYGMLRDQLWAPDASFADRFYFGDIGSGPAGAWIDLRTQGVGGMLSFTHLRKRITLAPDSPVVQVHYELQNDPNSQTTYSYGLWCHNFLGVRGENARYFFPTEGGVVEEKYDPTRGLEVWHWDPARGWAALVGDSGAGLAATMDFRYLNCFYMWGGKGTPIPTFEWRYTSLPLKAGESFQTDITFVPFRGLTRVDGVVGDVVGQIEPPGESPGAVRVTLYRPPGTPGAEAVVEAKSPGRDAWRVVARGRLREGITSLNAGDTGLATTGGVVRVTLTRSGKDLGSFERPVNPPGQTLAYHLAPLEERVGQTGPAPERAEAGHELSTAVVTPHIPWAKPYCKGPLRALVLCDDHHCREVIELWQRLDLKLEYVKFFSTYEKEYLYQGDRSVLSLEAAQRRLQEKLKQGSDRSGDLSYRAYDVIIISGLKWDFHFSPANRKALAEMVERGTGLVYVEPDGLTPGDELQGICGIPDGEKRSLGWYGQWESPADHQLTAGLPWELFPRTRRMPFLTPPPGEVLATIKGTGEQPLMVAGKLGQGRVLTLTYDTLTHEPSYRGFSALTPAISYRGAFCLPDEMKPVTWDYWEPWYALLCRAAVWAAGKDSGVRFSDLDAGKPGAAGRALGGKLLGPVPEGARLEVTFRDRYSHEVLQAPAPLEPQAGGASFRLPLPAELRSGQSFADLILRDRAGGAVAWGRLAFAGPPGPAIQAVQVQKRTVTDTEALWTAGQPYQRLFRAREPLKVTCRVETVLPWREPASLTARLSDCHGRVEFEQTRALGPNDSAVDFSAQPPVLYNMGHRWDFELRQGEAVRDTAHAELLILPPREWNRFTFTSWGGNYLWRSEYLFDLVRRQVEDLGLDVAMNGITELETGKVWWDYWQNVGHSYLGLLSYMGPGVPDFVDSGFGRKAAEYAKTRDKKWLVREPSLSDPAYLQKMTAALRDNLMPRVKEFGGAYDYCMGDEMSLTDYTQYFDYDFSPSSLAAFRRSLQARYPSLDELNRAWETTFATWDAVMPMTLDEVKGRANAAPWAEFRDFMNDTMAGYFALVQDTIRKTDPGARCGLSGTQEPKPGNGMDWWKNSGAFSYYHSYNTGWSDEMRRSFGPSTGVAQSPYRAGYWQAGRGLEYQMFWCLLHDTKGISAWATPLFFYGDLTLSESGADTRRFLGELKGGLWDLIRSAHRKHDGIAIHYSQPSINAALLMNKDQEIVQVRDAWVKLIEDLGLQYNFVSYKQVEAGLLNNPKSEDEKYKVLILPESIALSPKEVAEMRRFVEAGGWVVGDQCIGLMDDKCRRQPRGLLDDLFGITRTGEEKALPLGIHLQYLPEKLMLPAGEATVRAKGAVALGSVEGTDTPVVLDHAVGKGEACLLNINLASFENERRFSTPTEKGLRRVVQPFLIHGPSRDIHLQSGKPSHVEVIRYQAGPLEYLGLLRPQDTDGDEVAQLPLRGKHCVYDVRAHGFVGELDQITAPLQPGECRLYCLSPTKLADFSLTTASAVALGGELSYALSPPAGGPGAPRLVRLTVLTPEGREVGDYARNLFLGRDEVAGSIRFALNDPPGQWTLRATDIVTGQTAEARFGVAAP